MDSFAIRNLIFSYPHQDSPALQELNLEVAQGEFLVLCGPSGCGKTTLLRQLKSVLAPHGVRSGEILFEGQPLEQLDLRSQSALIGFVQQLPENQLVTDKVWHELAFGLESLGFNTLAIRGRVAEMASFFGIESWFYKSITELSGGQKQLLNLASIMAMQPSVLILDEPTSQLDPIAASEFLAILGKINRELGTTVILTEQRLEEAFTLASRVAVMDQGRLLCLGTPSQVGQSLRSAGHGMLLALPAPLRIWAAVENEAACPVTVGEGRRWLADFAAFHSLGQLNPDPPKAPTLEPAISALDLWFRYEKNLPDIVKGLSLTVHKGEFFAVLGSNGAGKTTALGLVAGLRKPYRGQMEHEGSLGILPQNPQTLFVKKTVREDLLEIFQDSAFSKAEKDARISHMIKLCRLEALLSRHPYDLSGGEQQRVALAKVLLTQPSILLLDEPTKGLDAEFKQGFAEILHALLSQGVAILMVSHDIEFCAEHAHRCGLFFDGSLVAQGSPREFFSGNSFYTTAANRMARGLLPRAITAEDVILACGGALPPRPLPPQAYPPPPPTGKIEGGTKPPALVQIPSSKRKLSKRTLLAAVIILLLIPLTLFIGFYYFGGRKYYFIALLVMLECMLPFFLVFEGRKPQARELIIIAVLCAIGVAGRAAFFMLPQFKPVIALTIIAGVAFGGETGFLVGAMTMLSSNALFSQGPWTPWQMFAMGLIGFLAGVLFRRGLLRRTRLSLCLFGGLSAIFIYGGIMNPASALMWIHTIDWKMIFAYYASGLPMDCVQAAATVIFLWLAGGPMLEKLDRIKTKYGLPER